MKKQSLILTFLLIGSLIIIFYPTPAKCAWNTPTQLTSNTATDAVPSISGDGSKIAFDSDVDGDLEIYVVIQDNTPPTGSIIIDGGATFTLDNSVTLSLTYSDENGVKDVRYSDHITFTTEEWESPTSTKEWTLPSSGDGWYSVYYQVRDNANNTANFEDSINLDTTLPTGSIVIDGGETFTTDTSVTLSLTYEDGNGIDEVRYSNDGVFDTEPWESPAQTKEWTLSHGDGTKTVYYQVRDIPGNTDVFSDTIILDTTPSMEYHDVVVDQTTFVVSTCSNSTVSDLSFNQELGRLRFTVDGTTGTAGFCNITIPIDLMSGDFTIYLDDVLLIENIDYTETYNGTHYLFNAIYEHSSHTIEIFSTEVISELSSIMLLASFIVATIVVIIYGKNLQRKRKIRSDSPL